MCAALAIRLALEVTLRGLTTSVLGSGNTLDGFLRLYIYVGGS